MESCERKFEVPIKCCDREFLNYQIEVLITKIDSNGTRCVNDGMLVNFKWNWFRARLREMGPTCVNSF